MAHESSLIELSIDECLDLLHTTAVGRLAFMSKDAPMLLPVNYRFIKRNGPHWVLIRTRRGSVIDESSSPLAAFEIDSIDPSTHTGWSVVARGALHHLSEDEVEPLRDHFDPEPWAPDHDEWLVLKCSAITGRRLTHEGDEWPFDSAGYL